MVDLSRTLGHILTAFAGVAWITGPVIVPPDATVTGEEGGPEEHRPGAPGAR